MLLLSPHQAHAEPDAAADWDWAQASPNLTLLGSGCSTLADLPPEAAGETDVVLIVPPSRLSWHRIQLPPVPARKRLAALHGLLEEVLLDEPERLQFALPPGKLDVRAPVWVAVCDRGWLDACIAALRAAGRTVRRIVPAVPPAMPQAQTLVWSHAEGDGARLTISGPAGVVSLPAPWNDEAHDAHAITAVQTLIAAAQRTASGDAATGTNDAKEGAPQATPAQTGAQLSIATPDTMAAAQAALPQLSWQTETTPRQWLRGAASGWNLAQFELQEALGAQRGAALRAFLSSLWHESRWRALRWGLGALLLVHVAGLHALAWQERKAVRDLRTQTQRVVTQTFPHLTVVLDAPRQMGAELERLRRNAGELGPADLESLLQALGAAQQSAQLSASFRIEGLRYTGGLNHEVRLRHARLSEADRAALEATAARLGWQLQKGQGGSAAGESVLKRGRS